MERFQVERFLDRLALLAAAEPGVLVTSLDDIDLDALAEGRLAQSGA